MRVAALRRRWAGSIPGASTKSLRCFARLVSRNPIGTRLGLRQAGPTVRFRAGAVRQSSAKTGGKPTPTSCIARESHASSDPAFVLPEVRVQAGRSTTVQPVCSLQFSVLLRAPHGPDAAAKQGTR
jgi:hypothetical protein